MKPAWIPCQSPTGVPRPNAEHAFVGNRGRTGDDRPADVDWSRHAQTDKFSLFARTRESFLLGSVCLQFLENTPRLPQPLAVGLDCFSWGSLLYVKREGEKARKG